MKTMAFAAPILPGKTEDWKNLCKDLQGPRKKEFTESRRRMGVKVERTYLQHTPGADMVIVSIEGDDAENFFKKLGSSADPFDAWFRKRVMEIHGTDLAKQSAAPSQPYMDFVGR